uniref:FAR1 domain-containing protein n=1 Tax=Hydatigena taeniaeformis TaxID=6205 RepID=A0A0R3WYG0_HYDTA
LVYARAHFECVRYGWSESNTTSRPVVSKRIGCKAYVVIQTYKGWVEIFHLNMQHNHEINQEDAGHSTRQSRRIQTNKQAATTTTTDSGSSGNYTYFGAPTKGIGSSTECMQQNVLRRLQGPTAKPEESLKEEDYFASKGNTERVVVTTQSTERAQTMTAEEAKLALLDSQLEAVRNLAITEYGLVGTNGACSEVALAMCEELKQMEAAWIRCLAETEAQQEAAPILLEFASASATDPITTTATVKLHARQV